MTDFSNRHSDTKIHKNTIAFVIQWWVINVLEKPVSATVGMRSWPRMQTDTGSWKNKLIFNKKQMQNVRVAAEYLWKPGVIPRSRRNRRNTRRRPETVALNQQCSAEVEVKTDWLQGLELIKKVVVTRVQEWAGDTEEHMELKKWKHKKINTRITHKTKKIQSNPNHKTLRNIKNNTKTDPDSETKCSFQFLKLIKCETSICLTLSVCFCLFYSSQTRISVSFPSFPPH